MRAGWRLGIVIWAAGLMLGPAPALAQDATQSAQPAPSDSIGPRELQNFSLNAILPPPAEPVPPQLPPPAPAPSPGSPPPAPATNRQATPSRPAADERAAAVAETSAP